MSSDLITELMKKFNLYPGFRDVRPAASVLPFSRLSHWHTTIPLEYVMTEGKGL